MYILHIFQFGFAGILEPGAIPGKWVYYYEMYPLIQAVYK